MQNRYEPPLRNVELMPVSGASLRQLLDCGADEIYIVDVGPNFEYYCNTDEILRSEHLENILIKWYDHHLYAWKPHSLKDPRLIVANEACCARIVKPIEKISPGKNYVIAYSNDVDGAISTLILLLGNRILHTPAVGGPLFELRDIAAKCDRAMFIRHQPSFTWHKAVYMNRHSRLIWDTYEAMIAKKGHWSKCRNLAASALSYDNRVLPINMRLIKERRRIKGVPVIDSAGIDNCDISFIADYLREESPYLVVESNGTFKITANDGLDLSALFCTNGTPFKVSLKKQRIGLTIDEIVDRIVSRSNISNRLREA